MKKRVISLLACGALAVGATAGLTACGDKGITIWGPAEQQQMLKEMVASFLEENPDFKYEINLGVVSEADAYANLSKDVAASADVFAFANDQLMNLKTIGGLARLSDEASAKSAAENDANSVEATKVDGVQYAYPYASDNGFFMYYDKSVISAEQAESLEDIMDACEAAGKYFIFDIDNSWYVGSFLYGAGGDYTINWNGSLVGSIDCDFDAKSPDGDYTYGEIGGNALIKLHKHKNFVNGDDNTITKYLADEGFGACVSGTWKGAEISTKLGANYAATKLPTYHSELTNKDYQIKSFSGFKFYGVNASSKHLAEAHQIAAYLSGEKMQEKRFDTFGIGPSNKVVAAKDKVKSNVALAALLEQAPHAKIQDSLPPSYWSNLEAFGTDIHGDKITDANLKEKITALTEKLKSNT